MIASLVLLALTGTTVLFFVAKDFFTKALATKLIFDALAVVILFMGKEILVEQQILAVIVVFVGTALPIIIFSSGLVECQDQMKKGKPDA